MSYVFCIIFVTKTTKHDPWYISRVAEQLHGAVELPYSVSTVS